MSEFAVDWETLHRYGVQDGRREVTSRMPVPGGWLYRYTAMDGPDVLHVTMCFVPHKRTRLVWTDETTIRRDDDPAVAMKCYEQLPE